MAPFARGASPLSPSEFGILLALADDERHGYGILQEIARQSAGAVRLGPGTLYGAIKRLLAAGWIQRADERSRPPDDDPRRSCYYRLTSSGRDVAAREAERLANLVREAEAKRLVRAGVLSPAPGDA